MQKKEIIIKPLNGEKTLYQLVVPPALKVSFTDSKSSISLVFKRFIGVHDKMYPEPVPINILSDLYKILIQNLDVVINYYVADELVGTVIVNQDTYVASAIVDDTSLDFTCEQIDVTNFKSSGR